MRKHILKSFAILMTAGLMASCGDSFLETDIYDGVDVDSGIGSAETAGYALNGTYYRLFNYYFAGNYANNIGDIASDITYWNTNMQHWNAIYTFTYDDTNGYFSSLWNYGYKVIDNSARVIQACENLMEDSSVEDEIYLKLYEAEARCLRAYASQVLVNVFCHQVKVNGVDYSSMPGIVVVDEPIVAYDPIERSTIGETYNQIVNDLKTAIKLYEEIGGDRGDLYYFNEAAAYGLLARAYTYLEDWSNAIAAAQGAIAVSGIDELAYTVKDYMALYADDDSNWESMFALAINNIDNWSANSCGTLYTTYGYSASPYLMSLYGENDVRLSLLYFTTSEKVSDWAAASTFSGGKFYFGGGNTAYATNYIVNAPEMFLIQAEGYANLNQISQAQDALLVVAKRNPDITTGSDVGTTQAEILSFLHDERARELFQEGHRLWDLRRWGVNANFNAYGAPAINFYMNNYNAGDLVFPVPAAEINAGFGVTQNENWGSSRPSING